MEARQPAWLGRSGLWLCVAIGIGIAACGQQEQSAPAADAPQAVKPFPSLAESSSPDARPETTEAMRLDLETPRHPADGAGRAWIVAARPIEASQAAGADPPAVQDLEAGSRARIDLVFEAGPLGVATGGRVLLQVSPFWDWDTPQTYDELAPGFTEVRTDAVGVELRPLTLAESLLGIEIAGRPLAAGEQIHLRYGAGPRGARVDRYAERGERIWFGVDGDGDGVRGLLVDSPTIDILPRAASRLVLNWQTTAEVGQPLTLHIALLDEAGNAHAPFQGSVSLSGPPELEFPKRVHFEAAQRGVRRIEVRARRDGVYKLHGLVDTPGSAIEATSNPVVVRSGTDRVLWADVHGHSGLSDGTGTPEDYMRYARDVAGLDVVALTDHDHWGMQFLDASPKLWDRIGAATKAANQPGQFVALLGFEWTSWVHGHRHVLYFEDAGDIVSSIDPNTETPAQLWDVLRGKPALTFAHHSAGGPIGTNWAYPPDPVLEPITEIVSVHGSSESADTPDRIYAAVAGNYVRDALDHGYTLGLIGSGDGHDGHPGLAGLAAPAGNAGLAAILSEDKTRAGVLAALRARRVYATNGSRIWLSVRLDGLRMGETISPLAADKADEHSLEIEVVGTGLLEAIDLVVGGAGERGSVESIPIEHQSDWQGHIGVPALRAGQYLYVRVRQQDGGTAWSSPFFWR